MKKLLVSSFKSLDESKSLGTMEFNGITVEYKKYLTFEEKKEVVEFIVDNTFDTLSGTLDTMIYELVEKYVIARTYFTNLTLPQLTIDDVKEDDLNGIYDILMSSGLYNALLVENKSEIEYLQHLTNQKIREKTEQYDNSHSIGVAVSNLLNSLSSLSPKDFKEMLKTVKEIDKLENFKTIKDMVNLGK